MRRRSVGGGPTASVTKFFINCPWSLEDLRKLFGWASEQWNSFRTRYPALSVLTSTSSEFNEVCIGTFVIDMNSDNQVPLYPKYGLLLQSERLADLLEGIQSDPSGSPPGEGHIREDPFNNAVGQRRKHEHASHLGRRSLRIRRALRYCRRIRYPNLAGKQFPINGSYLRTFKYSKLR